MTSSKNVKRKPTQLQKLLKVKDAIRTADTPEKQAVMEDIIKQYALGLGYSEYGYRKFRAILLQKYPFPSIKKELLQ